MWWSWRKFETFAAHVSLHWPASRAIFIIKLSLPQTAIYYWSEDEIQRQSVFLQRHFDSAVGIRGTNSYETYKIKTFQFFYKVVLF